jgi:hypothetical protein
MNMLDVWISTRVVELSGSDHNKLTYDFLNSMANITQIASSSSALKVLGITNQLDECIRNTLYSYSLNAINSPNLSNPLSGIYS